jgi:hypothetical protein
MLARVVCPGTFDLLVYADQEAEVPRTWEESDPKFVANSEEVRLRSFTTKVRVSCGVARSAQ